MAILDAHVHLAPRGAVASHAGAHPPPEEVLDLLAQAGIGRAVCFPIFGLRPDNEGLAELARAHPGRILPFAWVNPHVGNEAGNEVRRLAREHGFRGVKLHPFLHAFFPNRELLDPVMRAAADLGLPVLVHSGHPMESTPWSIAELASRWPQVTVIMDHMGLQLGWVEDAIRQAERIPNLVLGLTAMPFHRKIREAVERVGPERVVWGSDAPALHPAVELLRVRVAGLSGEAEEAVLGGSMARLVGS